MGIDISDIKKVIYWWLPTNKEYVQETGRCGRDGEQAQALLCLGKGTSTKHADASHLDIDFVI